MSKATSQDSFNVYGSVRAEKDGTFKFWPSSRENQPGRPKRDFYDTAFDQNLLMPLQRRANWDSIDQMPVLAILRPTSTNTIEIIELRPNC